MLPLPADHTLTPLADDPLAHLPNDPLFLKRMLAELFAALRQEQQDKEALQQRLDQLLRRFFGPRTERCNSDQPWLFAELANAASTAPTPPATVDVDVDVAGAGGAKPPRAGHGRQQLPPPDSS